MNAVLSPELSALFAVLAITAAAASLGWPFLRLFPTSLIAIERRALQVLAGLGLLGVFMFLVGLWNLSRWTVVGTLVLALVPMLYAPLADSQFRRPLQSHWTVFIATFRHWSYVFAALILLVRLISALDLPRGTSDDISYHLLGPKIWLTHGSVHPVLAHSHTAFPATVEMLFASGMALSNDRSPGILSVVFAIILLIQAWGLARHLGADDRVGRLAVLLAATTPAILARVGVAFVDVAFAAFALAAARILLEIPTRPPLVAAGGFAGFSIGTKYTGILVAGTLILILLIPFGTRIGPKVRLRTALQFALVAFLVGCPWYVRNFVELGSPIYPPPPFIAERMPVNAMPLPAVREFNAYIMNWGGASFGRSMEDFLLLPFRVTFKTPAFGGFTGGIGLAILAFAPVGIARLRRSAVAMRWVVWALLLTLSWFFTQQEMRFTIHILLVLTVFAAFGAVTCLTQHSRSGRFLAFAALLITIGHGTFLVFADPATRLQAVFTGRSRQRYDPTRVPGAAAIEFVNTHPDVKRVLVNGRHFKLYYLDKPFIMIRGEHGERQDPAIPDAATALLHLHDLGITHIIDSPTTPDEALDVREVPGLKLVFEDKPIRIYRVE